MATASSAPRYESDLETWHLQSKDGPVTVEALGAILSRSMVSILRQMEDKPPELVMALLPSPVLAMSAVGVMEEKPKSKALRHDERLIDHRL